MTRLNDEILNIIESARKSHNNKQALFLEKYIDYYNMPIKDNVILYESFAGAGMIDSPYAIFLEFLRNDKFDDYIHVWVINNFENNNFRLLEYVDKPNVRFILYGSND